MEVGVERGSSEEVDAEVAESNGIPKQPMVCATVPRVSSLGGFFPTVRATALRRSAWSDERTSRGSKVFSLLYNSELNDKHT